MGHPTDRVPRDSRQFGDHDANKEHDAGLGESDPWRFTPSMLDPSSFAFASFANQHSGGFTPTPGGGMGSVFHNQAGDLHTPGMGFGLGTPLSTSNSEIHHDSASATEMHAFHPHLLHSQPYPDSNLFSQQQSYAPSSFVHQDSGYETLHGAHNALSRGGDIESHEQSNLTALSTKSYDNVSAPPMQGLEK